mgnify:CR=1 FL=1
MFKSYPPKEGKWQCPFCKKVHEKPHYPLPGQIEKTKSVDSGNRVKFGRESKNDELLETGPRFNDDGIPASLFCPHCGWQAETVLLVRVRKK